MAQALVRYLLAQRTVVDEREQALFAGVFAIFGHGNVAGLGEALEASRDRLPVLRAHNEQAMAHAAIAYAKTMRRRRMMACTTSVGPGATNMVTAAAVAHVNRLPVLLLPGDSFASRLPDPVLQQVEDFSDPTVTANDCFKPVSRYWDRITRPEQLMQSLPQAISVLTDPVDCGPVTLALPQDVQAEAYDYPVSFFRPSLHRPLRQPPDARQLQAAVGLIAGAERPLIVAGGGVHYSAACAALGDFAERLRIPVAETQAGKGALPWDHRWNVGAMGVTGSTAANGLADGADLIIAIGTRLQDFTTGSGLLIGRPDCSLLGINVARHDLAKRSAVALQSDARCALELLDQSLDDTNLVPDWVERTQRLRNEWATAVTDAVTNQPGNLPSDANVLGAVNQAFAENAVVVCAAGGLPGELHKLWRASDPDAYHVEYGYSCMGYEIAGGLGVKLARPEREVVVLVGDGSYLMLNSEIATSVALGRKLIVVVLDNGGFGCINRLQASCGGDGYNNLLDSSYATPDAAPAVDFAAHARSLGAQSEKADGIDALRPALERARDAETTYVVVIDTDPMASTEAGGAWWDVPVAEVSGSASVGAAFEDYRRKLGER
ncbi:MAG: 3D-(3,5/4)-trihydroxycyclohexane-1,2-dione acylhydrolase (decyclizing) [Gammaproteobacteria bacterium]|nr:3D-(3,5/4)-trihydroxycyclohexane-1,2-dione acylhydrolase (decyclizing) [Gammaproteobacteria bacterium]MDE0366298.1 3D-(3,5/4)-trihydroxycyclohexane-1,2-dione acylhydrolase (decyclizing) [Gammaproteobacteria bacterium]